MRWIDESSAKKAMSFGESCQFLLNSASCPIQNRQGIGHTLSVGSSYKIEIWHPLQLKFDARFWLETSLQVSHIPVPATQTGEIPGWTIPHESYDIAGSIPTFTYTCTYTNTYTFIYIYLYQTYTQTIYKSIYTYIYLYLHLCYIFLYLNLYLYIYINMYIYIYKYMRIRVFKIDIYIYMYICMIHTCTYTNTCIYPWNMCITHLWADILYIYANMNYS